MKKYKVSIGTPCSENWALMTITERGRHCASCNKLVIDFTTMNNDEIITYLIARKGERICGNFLNRQIQQPILLANKPVSFKWPAIAAMLIAGLFTITEGYSQPIQTTKHVYKTSVDKDLKRETEPGSDSIRTYTLTILSFETNQPVPMAKVTIKNVGEFTTDSNGNIKVSWGNKKIPSTIEVAITAPGFEPASYHFATKELITSHPYQLHLREYESIMLRGDVSIEEVR